MLEELRKNISLADFTKNAARIADDIDASGTVYCIKRRGKPGIMRMDASHYEAMQQWHNAHWRERLAQSQRDFAAGRGRDLEEIAKELGLDRPAQPRRRGAAPRTTRAGRSKAHAREPETP